MERTQIIHIQVARHTRTGLLLATSSDFPRLMVAAETVEELNENLPKVVRDMLEASGIGVISVDTMPDNDDVPDGFVTGKLVARAKLAA